MAEIKNVQQLPESVRKKIADYVGEFIVLHGDNILSIVVYGSAAGVNFIPRVSDINIAVVLKILSFNDLRKSLPLVRKGLSGKITAPLFLTLDYIRQSLDVFPVEFLDLRDQHILLYGDDVFAGMKVDEKHLRLFCEEQIKGKLLRIRQAYLEIGLNAKGKEALLKDSLNALMPIFRNLLKLANRPVPLGKEDILRALGLSFGIDSGVLVTIYRDHTNDEKIAGHEIEDYLEKYLGILEKLAVKVD